jgi:hypothetical protein
MKKYTENIDFLIADIKDKIGKPVSNRVVAATIESLGIRDKDTLADFGVVSIKILADIIFQELTTSPEHFDVKNRKEIEASKSKENRTILISDYLTIKAKIFAHYYPLGIFHLLPVFLQIVAIVFFGYSLWTYVGFNLVQSTAVVLGVIVGLICTGGFVQVIGRQASFFWNHEDYFMTRQTINYLIKMGAKSILLVLALIFFFNFIFHLYPIQVLFIVFMYAFLIGLLLLFIAPLHTIEQRWVISIAILAATSTAILLKSQTNLMIYFTHWIGILIAILISKLYLVYFFNRKIGKSQVDSNLTIKISVMLYQNYNYFFYGVFIYVFIFIDRILAWSSSISGALPFLIYFDKDYEVGMDMAILVFLLLAGVLEYSIASFSRFIEIGQKATTYRSPELFNKQLLTMYWQNVVILLITSVLIFILIYYLITASWGYEAQFNAVLVEVSVRVCFIGGFGYFFLAWGMLNTLYLFTLGKPAKSLRAIILACVLNLAVGFILSRFFAYEYSVIGMLCGAILFMLLTLRENIKFFKNLDYYYYAAY